jgi:urea transport system substrate-binding protein
VGSRSGGRQPLQQPAEGARLGPGQGGEPVPFGSAIRGASDRCSLQPAAAVGGVHQYAATVGRVDVAVEQRALPQAVDDPGRGGSAVRHAVPPVTAGRIPYVYTSLYEGGETRPGVFCSGETPGRQIAPALRWLRDVCGVRRWFVVGDDYIWPRASVEVTREFARRLDLEPTGTAYVPLGTDDYRSVVERIRGSDAQGVLLYLVGQDAVHVNRVFAEEGLQESLVRFTPLMEENTLLASGAQATRNLFVCASYFRSLATPSAMEFGGAYVDQHGPDAPPLNNAAESCYEGLMALAALAFRAGSLDVHRMLTVADGLGYDGGPRGPVSFAGNHLQQRVHLAVADGYDFDVLATL